MITDDDALHLADVIVSLLHAGLSVQRALFEAPPWLNESVAASVQTFTAALGVGAPLVTVVDGLSRLNPLLSPLLDVLAQAARDGAPAAEHLSMITAEVRGTRRRVHEQQLARLPVALTLPVVLCVLPAFIMLGVLPLFIAVMPSFGTA